MVRTFRFREGEALVSYIAILNNLNMLRDSLRLPYREFILLGINIILDLF